MFKDRIKKEIPESLKACTRVDTVSEQILRWTDSVDIIGKIIIVLNVIAGLAISIVLGVFVWDFSEEYISWFWPVITGLVITSVNVLIIHIVFQFITMLFSALASLVLNTRVTADVELFSASNEKNNPSPVSGNSPVTDPLGPKSFEPPIITDKATLEEYKTKIDEFLMGADDCDSIGEMLERWEKLGLERHPVVEHIQEMIANAASAERMYGKIGNNVGKTLDKVTSYYLKAKFRGEI